MPKKKLPSSASDSRLVTFGAPSGAGELAIVATPIGNLGDLTERARETLRDAEIILCEDTRRTRQLMSHLGLSTRLERCDAHAPEHELQHWVGILCGGARLALVTDAGTPGVSDPGSRLVAAAREAGVRVTPIPGASAVAALVSVLGARDAAEEADAAYAFLGFFPREAKARAEVIAQILQPGQVSRWIWFESPNRVVDALTAVAELAGSLYLDKTPQLRCVAAKELTKAFETIWDGTPADVAAQIATHVAREGERGEWCFALITRGILDSRESASEVEESAWLPSLRCLIAARVADSEAARIVSQEFGVKKRTVYERALQIRGKKI